MPGTSIKYRPLIVTGTKRAILPTVQRQKKAKGAPLSTVRHHSDKSSITDRSASKGRKQLSGYKLPTVQRHKDEMSYTTDGSAPKKRRGLYCRSFSVKITKKNFIIDRSASKGRKKPPGIYCRPFSVKRTKRATYIIYIYKLYILPTAQRQTGDQLHYRPFGA